MRGGFAPQFNDAQVKKFTGIQSDRTLARYRHLDNMDVALMAASVLDQRTAAQEAEIALTPFLQKSWSVEQRAKFAKAAQALADATEKPLTAVAEIVMRQMEAGKIKERKRSS